LAQARQPDSAKPPAILRPLTERLVRRLYENVRGQRSSISAHQVEQVIALAEAAASGRCLELPRGVEVERSFADLFFSAGKAAGKSAATQAVRTTKAGVAYQYPVSIPSRGETVVSVPEIGTCFRLKVIDWPLPERDTKTYGVALDADLLRAPVVLRNWRPGDAYRPLGRRQSRKLKQLFLMRRVPLRQRSGWPVLESAGIVIWARGFPPAADFSACRQTRSGVLIEEFRV
jgi:tRNA(Ile)-lysidine synthase